MRRHVLVVILLMIVAVVPNGVPAVAQSVPFYVINPQTTGTPGTFTASNPGVICRAESGSALLGIEVKGPIAKLTSGMSSGRVDWTPAVYQHLLDNRGLQVVRQGATQSLTLAANNTTAFQRIIFEHVGGGGYYSGGGTLTWYNTSGSVRGTYRFLYDRYWQFDAGGRSVSRSARCDRIATPAIVLSTTRTTVDTVVAVQGSYFPPSQPVAITWRGKAAGVATSDAAGNVSGSFRVTAAPMGSYPLGLDGGTDWKVSATVTIVPRIKLIPSVAGRGEQVKISLRGYAKGETVRVRWLKNGAWSEVGRVTMSSTGSGELWLQVPKWVPDGPSSIRGDGSSGRAQTNAVTISGGAIFSSSSLSSPTPTPKATGTATATVTPTATITPEPSPTESPTPIATATPEETATTTPEPTIPPTIEPTVEPTVQPSVEPTATSTAVATEPVTPTATLPVEPTVAPTIEPTKTSG